MSDALQGRLLVEPGQRLRERRSGPVQERLPGRLGVEQAENDDVEVRVLDCVDDDERAVGHSGEDLGHPLAGRRGGCPSSVMLCTCSGRIGAAALLGDELAQVRGGETEGGVAGELRLADRLRLARRPAPSARHPP